MLCALLLSLLYTASSQEIAPIYRVYLRGMKQTEDERIQAAMINGAITAIDERVFSAAKQGLLEYTTEPFEGCEIYSKRGNIDRSLCETVVAGIREHVSHRFPDSKLIYNEKTLQYTLKWG